MRNNRENKAKYDSGEKNGTRCSKIENFSYD